METLTQLPQLKPQKLLSGGDNFPPESPRTSFATAEPPRYGHPLDNFSAGQHELRAQTDAAFQQIASAEEQREFRHIANRAKE